MIHHQCPHPYHLSKHRRFIERTLALSILAVLVLFFMIGRWSVGSVEEYQLENARLQASVERLTLENKEFVKRQDFTENAKKIDSQAQQDSRRSMAKLHKELSDAKERLAFYQRVVSPEKSIKGLHISSFEIKALKGAGEFQYELMLAQGAGKKAAIKGSYSISILGELNGEVKTLSLVKTSKKAQKSEGFSFRYYEFLTGVLKLPNGFVAKHVEVEIDPARKNAKRFTKRWLWRDLLRGD
ncbi:MAG: DUF6776 family protein [Cycloclasticus sp.]